jgi:hypothetical protein
MDVVEDQVPDREWTLDLDTKNGFIVYTYLDGEDFDEDAIVILDYDIHPVIYRLDDEFEIQLSSDDDLVSFIIKILDEDVELDDLIDIVANSLDLHRESTESDEESE